MNVDDILVPFSIYVMLANESLAFKKVVFT
jgi:hypothetical protein